MASASLHSSSTQGDSRLVTGIKYCFLLVLIFSQFTGTSLWFVPNAVIGQIPGFASRELAALTSLVQVGFVIGTFVMAYFTVSDRFSAPVVFLVMCVLAAVLNALCMLTMSFGVWGILRLLVGFCLAGIYPVGMKIAAKRYPAGLGFRLGLLVGALTCGTAFPWLIRGASSQLPLQGTLGFVSALAVVGGAVMQTALIGAPKASGAVSKMSMGLNVFREIFADRQFVAACAGYWGHMWELYAMWAYVPLLAQHHREIAGWSVLSLELTVFASIGVGALSCPAAGLWSQFVGNEKVPGSAVAALVSLMTSCVCCLIAPLYRHMSAPGFLCYVLVWGWAVVADSAQFSSLSAKFAPKHLVGSALMTSTCVGFLITIVSIQLLGGIYKAGLDIGWVMFLLFPGPLVGIWLSYRVWPLHRLFWPASGSVGDSGPNSGDTTADNNSCSTNYIGDNISNNNNNSNSDSGGSSESSPACSESVALVTPR